MSVIKRTSFSNLPFIGKEEEEVIKPHEVVLGRNSQGAFGFSVSGGVEFDHLPAFQISGDSELRLVSGPAPKQGDEIVSINGNKTPGLSHSAVVALIMASDEEVTLELIDAPRMRHRISVLASPSIKANPSDKILREIVQEGVEQAKAPVKAVNVITIKRNDKNTWGFTIEGGPGVGELARVKAVRSVNLVTSSAGPMSPGDCIIAIDGKNVAGVGMKQLTAWLSSPDLDFVELTLISQKERLFEDIIKKQACDPTTLSLQADLKHTIEQGVMYTTAPVDAEKPSEDHVRHVSAEDFEAMRKTREIVLVTQEGDYFTGWKLNMTTPPKESLTRLALQAQAKPIQVVLKKADDQSYGFSLCGTITEGSRGVFIKSVKPDSVASKAGLKKGLHVLKVNGTEVPYASEDEVYELMTQSANQLTLDVVVNPGQAKTESVEAAEEEAERKATGASRDFEAPTKPEADSNTDAAKPSTSRKKLIFFGGSALAALVAAGSAAYFHFYSEEK